MIGSWDAPRVRCRCRLKMHRSRSRDRSEVLLNGQEPGVEFEYHVIAVNKAGEGRPSNIVRAVL